MKLYSVYFLSLIFSVIEALSPIKAHAADIIPLGENSRYLCVKENGKVLLKRTFGKNSVSISFEAAVSKINFQINTLRFLRSNIIRAHSNRRFLSRLEKRISDLRSLLISIEQCRSGELFPPDKPHPGADAPACEVAGGTVNKSSLRIINGETCSLGDSPVVKVDVSTAAGNLITTCSGVAISQRVVITSAHCFPGFAGKVEIINGAGNFLAQSFHRHPDFIPYGTPFEKNDIAVVLVTADLNTRVTPLMKVNDYSQGERAIIAGYGDDENGSSGALKAGNMKINSYDTFLVTALFDGTGSNTCLGDSGGPLYVFRNNEWILGALTSSGDLLNCGPGDTSRFTNISDPSNQAFIENYL